MEVVPAEAGRASRAWDEQHLDLVAAAGLVGGAPAGGFAPEVATAALRFTSAWRRHVSGLADDAEQQADSLRRVIADVLRTDEAAALDVVTLGCFLKALR